MEQVGLDCHELISGWSHRPRWRRHGGVVDEVNVGLHTKGRRHEGNKGEGPSDGIDSTKKVAGAGEVG